MLDFMPSILAASFAMLTDPGFIRGLLARGLWARVVLAALALSLSGCAWLDAQQHQIALRPTPGKPAGTAPDHQLFKPKDERRLLPIAAHGRQRADGAPATTPDLVAVWWLPHADPDAPSLLYLHGTFRNLYRNLPKINALREAGFSVLAVDYRGWGDSTAIIPTEATITADAALAWAEFKRRQPDPALRVIFGHSMGGSVAVRLASGLRGAPDAGKARDYAALVLESTFTRMPDVAGEAGVVGRLLARWTTIEFDSLSRIDQIDAPLHMLHSAKDDTVPIALGRRLRDAARPGVQWTEFAEGTHSRLHSEVPQQYRQLLGAVAKAVRDGAQSR